MCLHHASVTEALLAVIRKTVPNEACLFKAGERDVSAVEMLEILTTGPRDDQTRDAAREWVRQSFEQARRRAGQAGIESSDVDESLPVPAARMLYRLLVDVPPENPAFTTPDGTVMKAGTLLRRVESFPDLREAYGRVLMTCLSTCLREAYQSS